MKRSSMTMALALALWASAAFAQDTALTVTPSGNVGIGTTSPGQKLDVRGNIAVTGTVDGVDVSTLKSDFDGTATRYTKFTGLNNNSVNVTTAYTKLSTTATSHTFTKARADTKVEIIVNSRFSSGTFGGTGTNGVMFQARVDDSIPPFGHAGAIPTTATTDYLSFFSMYPNLPAGTHTVSIWARSAPGAASASAGVLADPGGWDGTIIVKETH